MRVFCHWFAARSMTLSCLWQAAMNLKVSCKTLKCPVIGRWVCKLEGSGHLQAALNFKVSCKTLKCPVIGRWVCKVEGSGHLVMTLTCPVIITQGIPRVFIITQSIHKHPGHNHPR
jgi:hypothetical protein